MEKKSDPIVEAKNMKKYGDLQEPKDSKEVERKSAFRMHGTKQMKLFPELYRSDVSIHPSYTDLKNLP